MSLAALKAENSVAQETDTLSTGTGAFESGLYNCTVKMAYLGESSSGSVSLTLHLDTDNGEFKHTIYLTSGKAKGQKKTYERNGQKHYLPSFIVGDSLCMLTLGIQIGDMVTEDKIVKIYDYNTQSEEPTSVPVFTALLGQPIIAGIIKRVVDKNKNVAPNGATPDYKATGETKEDNVIDKLFRAADGLTTTEILAGTTESAFRDSWGVKHTGVTQMKAKGLAGGTAQSASALVTPAAVAKPEKSIFG